MKELTKRNDEQVDIIDEILNNNFIMRKITKK